MRVFADDRPFRQTVEGPFFCAFNPVTRQAQLTMEATSADQAQQRMAAVAYLVGIEQAAELFYVVLETAPQGVPTFPNDFFSDRKGSGDETIASSSP